MVAIARSNMLAKIRECRGLTATECIVGKLRNGECRGLRLPAKTQRPGYDRPVLRWDRGRLVCRTVVERANNSRILVQDVTLPGLVWLADLEAT